MDVEELRKENELLRQRLREEVAYKTPAEGMCVHPFVMLVFDEMCMQNVTQRDLAKRAGLCPGTIRRWMCGKRSPSLIPIEATLSVLGYELRAVRR